MGTTMVYSGYVGIPGAEAFDAGSCVGSLCRGNFGSRCRGGGVGLRALGFTVQGLWVHAPILHAFAGSWHSSQ